MRIKTPEGRIPRLVTGRRRPMPIISPQPAIAPRYMRAPRAVRLLTPCEGRNTSQAQPPLDESSVAGQTS